MTLLRVVEPGMFTTVQDLGRPGYGAIGVPPSGAADPRSLVIANRLLGNADNTAGLECTLLGPSVTLDEDRRVCIAGARFPDARIGGRDGERPLPWCEPTLVRAGELIKLGGARDGARASFCVEGGIGVSPALGSRSTLTTASMGGHEGRPLRGGDTLPLGFATDGRTRPGSSDGAAELRDDPLVDLRDALARVLARRTIRVIPSLHTDRFPAGALERLAAEPYSVGDQSNRVGVRFDGPALPLPAGAGSFDSEPTVTGGIQIPGDGRPIALGVDRPPTGGYPLLACVVAADLPALAMLGPRDAVRFEVVSLADARRIADEQRRAFDDLLPRFDREALP